jgi:predicted nucleotidyltransferase
MLKKEYELLKPFVEKPWLKFTFKQVKEYSKKKSKSYTYNVLGKFVKEGILKEENAGNVNLYHLNLNYTKAQIYAGIIAEYTAWNKKHIPYDDINDLLSKIPTSFFIFAVTGSYARNKQTKGSDIDIIVICDDCTEPKKIYAELRHACEMNIPKIHLYVFKKSELLEMLLSDKANYGKEMINNNIIIYGGAEYFKILCEAIKNGFNG